MKLAVWRSNFDPPKKDVYFWWFKKSSSEESCFFFFDFCNLDFYDLYNICLKIIHFLLFWPFSMAGGKTEIIIWPNLSFLWLANYVNIKFYIFSVWFRLFQIIDFLKIIISIFWKSFFFLIFFYQIFFHIFCEHTHYLKHQCQQGMIVQKFESFYLSLITQNRLNFPYLRPPLLNIHQIETPNSTIVPKH